MEKQDKFIYKLDNYFKSGLISEKYYKIIKDFYFSYLSEVTPQDQNQKIFLFYLEEILKQLKSPYQFSYYHEKILSPINYYQFGIDFLKPLVEKESKVFGLENIEIISRYLQKNENVILLANHQTESDPQAISILLDNSYRDLAKQIIYVAGERVITDPLAIPFSLGCDLLCIYSKKYISEPPEKKNEKQLHNKKTMNYMSELLKEGRKIIYVAPSGGRDRPNDMGEVELSPFDPQSIEMFYLMAKKSNTKTHFFPLSLLTYNLLPPPDKIQIELGEKRKTKKGKIFAYFSEEINMNLFQEEVTLDKITQRKNRANYIFNIVKDAYEKLRSL